MASCDCPEGDSLFNIKDYQKAIVYYERCKFYCGGNLNHTGKFNLYQSYKLNHNYYDAAETINELLNDLQLSNDSTFKYLLLEKFMMFYFAKDLTSLKFEITHYLNYGSNDHLFQKRLYWFLIAIHRLYLEGPFILVLGYACIPVAGSVAACYDWIMLLIKTINGDGVDEWIGCRKLFTWDC